MYILKHIGNFAQMFDTIETNIFQGQKISSPRGLNGEKRKKKNMNGQSGLDSQKSS